MQAKLLADSKQIVLLRRVFVNRSDSKHSAIDFPNLIVYYRGIRGDKMSNPKGPKRAASYTRVSTREQSEDGKSLDVQQEAIEHYCKSQGYELVESYTDEGQTGTDLEREGLQKLIKDIKEDGIDIVVVFKLDRLVRSVRYAGYLVEDLFQSEEVELASVRDSFNTSTANGKLVFNLISSIAQWESDIISERTEDSLQHKRAKGEWAGRVPFGFKIGEDGKLTEDPEEQATIQKIKRAKRRGRSYREIADTYNISPALAHKLINTNLRTLRAEYGIE